jgi:hypothetical protein
VLEIEGRLDASRVESGFADVGDSAADMAREVDSASRKAEGAASRLDRVGESADNLDSKSAQATGSLGALSSGFELVGAEKYAMGLQSAALATDFLAGVGEGLNLITNLSIVQRARDALMAARQAVANRVAAAATRAQALAQRGLNLAMRANPIGLVITAALLLVAGFVLLYKRSERFRSIVQAVGRAGRAALQLIVAKAGELINWVGKRIPGGFSTMKGLVVGYIRLVTLPLRTVVTVAQSIVTWVRDKIPGAFATVKRKASEIGDTLTAPFRALRDMIQSVVGWIDKIDFPSPPKWIDKIPGVGRVAGRTTTAGPVPVGNVASTVIVQGIVDDRTVRQIERAQVNALRRVGLVR